MYLINKVARWLLDTTEYPKCLKYLWFECLSDFFTFPLDVYVFATLNEVSEVKYSKKVNAETDYHRLHGEAGTYQQAYKSWPWGIAGEF